jgi:predicted AlkP superfamily pyrophosphatase or phosphodiesterase
VKRFALFAAVVLSLACTAPKPPGLRPNTTPGGSRVILVSFDGVGADALAQFRASGAVGSEGYFRVAAQGFSAGRVIPVNPTLTAPSHISIATGQTPDVHGIVSNSFHVPGQPPAQWGSGFSADISSETLWEAARRQGKRVGVICFAGADGKTERRRGDWGLIWTDPVTRSRTQTLTRADFKSDWLPPGWRGPDGDSGSFSPVLRASTTWTFKHEQEEVKKEILISALDTTNDNVENYDRVVLREGSQQIPVQTDGWFATTATVGQGDEAYLYGSWSKVIAFDPQMSRTTIYWGAVARNEGYPASYRQMIDREVGFWPSDPDSGAAADWLSGKGGLPPEVFVEQMERYSDFFTRLTMLSMQRMPYDLIMAYQPIVDETEHQWRVENPRQLAFSEANAATALRVRGAAIRRFDEAVKQMLAATDLSNTALVITGDHGLSPMDTRVAVNRLLVDWGFASIREERLAPDTEWSAITSGNLAHLYRFGGGRTGAELKQRLEQLRTPEGEPVFERVLLKTPADHPNSGEVIAFAYPRFYMSSTVRGEIFEKATHYGQHGAVNSHPELHTIFAAAGARVVPGNVAVIQQTEIAPYVASLLGIGPPTARPAIGR